MRGKGTHEKKKSLKMFKEDAKGGNKSLEEEKNCKWQVGCVLFLVSVLCMSSYREQGSWQEICISKKVFIKKYLIQELYKLEKERNADDSKDRADAVWGKPVLKEGAVLFLKEGKLLFYRIREEEKQQKITD